ncbi:peptide ABC transporter ATP-binding protein [Mesobacillus campisalis]|uniref:Peptide ABC transporter ATP-binding protein n=1 Tax=Mesobacillus campisalis TaxID=1408103 RepID=A0A0M2SNF2_9BACI|nr:ABC transporter ATP-binding protein [Mesobacillus campisalis]KKK36139.1 peptide ABC transporter ATP-binding protein [Mesobacillus campisalis]
MAKTVKILEVKGLRTSFFTDEGEVKAVDGVDFSLERGKTIGIVGESGSGKSITSLSILRLIEESTGRIVGGEIMFKGENLLQKSKKQMMAIRGNNISMIFQEPMTSLNPTLTCGEQIAESIRIHQKANRKEAWVKAVDMLRHVGIPSPEKRAKQYPFELSGGMRQRVMIAIALACNPELLIADEPTTALDVTIQAQILELIKKLQEEMGTSLMIITHDLGVVAEMCDKVAVMYCGKVVEYADVKTIFTNPKHPYTVGLLNSVPKHDQDYEGDLAVIPGAVPSPFNLPQGCRFAPRCPHARGICREELPELLDSADGDQVRCWIYSEKWEKQEEEVR